MVEIFIIDPHHLTRSGLVSVLGAEDDINVCGEVGSAEEAVEKIDQVSPDLILLDLALLGTSGVKALKKTAERHPNCKTIVFSSNVEDEHLIAALNLGAHAYVLKGTTVELLLCALRAVAAGASWMDPIIAKRLIAMMADMHAKSSTEERFIAASSRKANTLSQREKEVLSLLAKGFGNRQIALHLFLSPDTVKSHVRHIFDKLDATSRTDAAIKGMRAGLCDLSNQLAVS